MTTSYQLDVKNGASPALREKIDACRSQRLAAFIGPAVARLTRDHFRGLPDNRMGWPSTGFWRGAAQSTSWQQVPEGVVISVAQIGVRQRYQGGEIHAVNKKALTIPVSAAAYGHVAADFPGSFVLTTKRGSWIVQYGAGRRKDATFQFLFRLVASVQQDPNPNVLPTDEEILSTAVAGATEAVK